MIWLSWRQFRTQAAIAVGSLAVLAIVLGITGPHLVHLYRSTVLTCQPNYGCPTARAEFLGTYRLLQGWLEPLMYVVPGIIGVFWGAPLVAREFETGTYRMVWTQSVTRSRWLTTKLVLLGLAAMVVAGLFSLMVTWWSNPLDAVAMNRFAYFDTRAVVPIGYAVFAFALGATIGVVIRRSLPAMATTMVVFIAARLAVARWIRPNLFSPLHRAVALDPASMGFMSRNGGPGMLMPDPPFLPNAWIQSVQIVDGAGRQLSGQVVQRVCPAMDLGGPAPGLGVDHPQVAPDAVRQVLHDCVVKLGATYHEVVTYQPANRFWGFQWYELAIFLAIAIALGWFSIWWVRHRLT